jgi:hypothetical protein
MSLHVADDAFLGITILEKQRWEESLAQSSFRHSVRSCHIRRARGPEGQRARGPESLKVDQRRIIRLIL